MMSIERKHYDREFKQKAVELSFARGSAKEITDESGIPGVIIPVGKTELSSIAYEPL